tara:strand:- start:713 stop:922 length:210 start_codon:yes stop_codon:yes gene_type:complete
MYYTKITSNEDTLATNRTDMLSNAVNFANTTSNKGDTVSIYEAIERAEIGSLILIQRVMSWTDDGWSRK